MLKITAPVALFLLALSLVGCDAASVESAPQDGTPAVAAEVQGAAVVGVPPAPAAVVTATAEVKPEALDLESITFLLKKDKIKDAKALEKQINTPKEKLNTVDIDGDGKIDKIVIVEVKKDDGTIVFELHAVPSKSKSKDEAIVVAYITFVPDKTTQVLVVKATYAPIVIGHDTIVYDYTVPIVVENDVIVVRGGVGFYGWLYAVHRPAYYGVFIYEVAPAPVIIIDLHGDYEEGCWPPGHCKHGKWKGKGKHGKHGKWD